jgi:hypothetical protein
VVLAGQEGPPGPELLTVVDTAGGQHGSVSFNPPPTPHLLSHSIVTVQAPAVAAAGRAFYLDSGGSVYSMVPDASPVKVASFPFRSGEEISFAVSPDARRIMAIINEFGDMGQTQYSVYVAAVGGTTTLLRGPVSSSSIARLFTWITEGPVVITDASQGYQGCEAGECAPWGHAVLVDPASGAFGSAVGGSDCAVWDVGDAGVLCSSGRVSYQGATPANLSVRALDGSSSRQVAVMARCDGCYWDARLSPNGDVAFEELVAPAGPNDLLSVVISRAGALRAVAGVDTAPGGRGDFAPYLWFDAQTVIGVTTCPGVGCTSSGGTLARVSTSDLALKSVALGLVGTPVGVLFG